MHLSKKHKKGFLIHMAGSIERKEQLSRLITKFNEFKKDNRLDTSSEQTIRSWLDRFLLIFGWDVKDTSQILQGKILSKEERTRLRAIGSYAEFPDYSFKRGNEKLLFLDAKDIDVNIRTDKAAAFQIKSYGWSISAPCSFTSNFEELAIYDCTYIPNKDQEPNFGRIYFTVDQYLDNFEIIDNHFFKDNIYSGILNELYSDTLKAVPGIVRTTPDLNFAQKLS